MSSAHEIVTIQAGCYANFVGTHWWNIQESSFCYDQNDTLPLDINHDVLFREGLNYKSEVTFTPRLILIDLKDNLKSIRQECPLYRFPDDDNDPLWEGSVEVMKQPPVKKNPFLEDMSADLPTSTEKAGTSGDNNSKISSTNKVLLDSSYDFNSSTTTWSDYLRTNLHPRSLCLLDEKGSESRNALDIYSSGEEVYKKDGKDMIKEAIRKQTEECDYLQGFQLIYDSCNGFTGICNNILQHLDDEYKSKSVLCFPTYQNSKPPPYQNVKEQMHRLYAVLLSLSGAVSFSSLFSPLCLSSDVVKLTEPYRKFPFLNYNINIPYQTSSVFAAAIETLTSQFRLRSHKFTMSDVTSAMSMYSRKLVCSSVCLPFPLSDDEFLSTMVLKDIPEYYMTSISPFYNPESEKTLYQSAVLRGVPKSKFLKPGKSMYNAVDPEQIFGEYLNKYSSSSVTTATVFYEQCPVVYPFPKIFNNSVGINGFVNSRVNPNEAGVEKVPVAASFSSSDSAAKFLDCLLTESNKTSFKEYVKSAESSFEKDEFIEVLQNLIGLRDNYQDY